MSLNRGPIEPRPPAHDRVCWASAVGGARHLIPLDGWDAAYALAVTRLETGEQQCICARRRGQHRGRRHREQPPLTITPAVALDPGTAV